MSKDLVEEFLSTDRPTRSTLCKACNTPGVNEALTVWLDMGGESAPGGRSLGDFEELVLRAKLGYDARSRDSLRTHIRKHMKRHWSDGRHLE